MTSPALVTDAVPRLSITALEQQVVELTGQLKDHSQELDASADVGGLWPLLGGGVLGFMAPCVSQVPAGWLVGSGHAATTVS